MSSRGLATLSVDEVCELFSTIGLTAFVGVCREDEIDGFVLNSTAIFTPAMVDAAFPTTKRWQRAALLAKVADLREVGVRADLFTPSRSRREAPAAAMVAMTTPKTPSGTTFASRPPLPPSSPPHITTFAAAKEAFALGRYSEALGMFDWLLTDGRDQRDAPSPHALLFNSATCLSRLGRSTAAEERFASSASAAASAGGPAWRAHAARGSSMLQRGALESARGAFQTAVSTFPVLRGGGASRSAPSSSPNRADTTALATLQYNLGVAWSRSASALLVGSEQRVGMLAKAQLHLCASMRTAPMLTAVRERALQALAALPHDQRERRAAPRVPPPRPPHNAPPVVPPRPRPAERPLLTQRVTQRATRRPLRGAGPSPPTARASNVLATVTAAAIKRRQLATVQRSLRQPTLTERVAALTGANVDAKSRRGQGHRVLHELRGYATPPLATSAAARAAVGMAAEQELAATTQEKTPLPHVAKTASTAAVIATAAPTATTEPVRGLDVGMLVGMLAKAQLHLAKEQRVGMLAKARVPPAHPPPTPPTAPTPAPVERRPPLPPTPHSDADALADALVAASTAPLALSLVPPGLAAAELRLADLERSAAAATTRERLRRQAQTLRETERAMQVKLQRLRDATSSAGRRGGKSEALPEITTDGGSGVGH